MSARVRVTSHTDGQVLWQDAVGFTEYDAERCLQDWARKAWGRQNPYYYNALMCAYSANTFYSLRYYFYHIFSTLCRCGALE